MSEPTPDPAQQAVQATVSGVAADLGPGPQAPASDIGAAMAAGGAQPAAPDPAAMLAQIQALQAQMAALQAEKQAGTVPDVTKYAQAAADHVAAIATANPHLAGELADGVTLSADVAAAAADGAHPGGTVEELKAWVDDVAAKFPHINFGYVLQLAGEIAAAAAKIA